MGCQNPTYGGLIQRSFSRDKVIWVPGDETVPLKSAANIIATKNLYSLESSHSTMLTDESIRHKIVNIIAESNLPVPKVTENITDCSFNGTAVSSHSPVELHIYDSLGRHYGPAENGSFDFDIPSLAYDTLGHQNFAFLPSGSDYTVKLIATGSGGVSYDSSVVQNGQITSMLYFDDFQVSTGTIAKITPDPYNSTTIISLDVNGDGVVDETIEPSAVLNADESKDSIPPTSSVVISGEKNEEGEFVEKAKIEITAKDQIVPGAEAQTSGVLKILYKLDNEASYSLYQNPLDVLVGKHVLEFYSIDRAGNIEEPQKIEFVVSPKKTVIVSSGGGGCYNCYFPVKEIKKEIPKSEVKGITKKAETHPNGSLVQDEYGTIYLIENQAKRPFLSKKRLVSLGYKLKDVQKYLPGDNLLLLAINM